MSWAVNLRVPIRNPPSPSPRPSARSGSPQAATVLKGQIEKSAGNDERYFWIADALLTCADRRYYEGSKLEASLTYKHFNNTKQPRTIYLAALQGVLKTSAISLASGSWKSLPVRMPMHGHCPGSHRNH